MADTSEPLRFILVGKTGAGKSETGNTLLGTQVFPTAFSSKSATETYQLEQGLVDGRNVEIADTPGLFDTEKSEVQIAQCVVRALTTVNPGPHAVLYVMRCDVRYSPEEFNTFGRVKKYFGDKVIDHVIIVLTHGDQMEDAGVTVEEYFKTTPESLQSVVKGCENRYVVFNNRLKDEMREKQIKALMKLIDLKRGKVYTESRFSQQINLIVEEEIEKMVFQSSQSEQKNTAYVQQLEQEKMLAQKERDEAEAEVERKEKAIREEKRKREEYSFKVRREAARNRGIMKVILGATAALICLIAGPVAATAVVMAETAGLGAVVATGAAIGVATSASGITIRSGLDQIEENKENQ